METILSFSNFSAGYDKIALHEPFSLQIHRGEIVSLIGPNGAGKSTLLKTLIREISPVSGEIFYKGKNISEIPLKDFAKEVSALLTVSVKPELMTCRDVVSQGRYPHTGHFALLTDEDKKKIDEAIQAVHVEDFSEKNFMKVSDGQKQRVLFARALCQNPSLLVLDEPTSYLDIKWRLELLKILKELSQNGVTVISSMHEIDLALKISDRILCVGNGKIEELSCNEADCKRQIQDLYDLDASFYMEESAYSGLVKGFCKKQPTVEGESLPPGFSPQAVFTTPPSPKGLCPLKSLENTRARSIASCETRSKPVSQVLPLSGRSLPLMIQGTMSNAGKSFLVAGLCRIFKQEGFSVAPFKSQNMALNSFVTNEGLEIGRAQAMQAEASGVEPSVLMNPILLKPNDDTGSQVIVNGKPIGAMSAREYFAYKKSLVPEIKRAYEKLSSEHEIVVIEGAGSPAEINLKENDIVNMGMAEIADSPVLLVADIDRGGVFAQLVGTIELLEPNERSRVKGLIINKFRGDKSILDSGIKMLEEKTGIPVVGTVPYMKIQLDDEDSLSENLHILTKFQANSEKIQLTVVRLPHISNFTDFIPLQNHPCVNLYYVEKPKDLGSPDCIIIPGTKNTLGDLDWLKKTGLSGSIAALARSGTPICGICGGFQILGEKLETENGLELLPVETEFSSEKVLTRVSGRTLSNLPVSGYEIHEGRTCFVDGAEKSYFAEVTDSVSGERKFDGAVSGNVFGTYIHGLFDSHEFTEKFLEMLAKRRNLDFPEIKKSQNLNAFQQNQSSREEFKESQYNLLADTLRKHLDMEKIYGIMGILQVEL